VAEAGTPTDALDQAKRLELITVRVRWFGVLLGVFLVATTNQGSPPHASSLVVTISFVAVGLIAAANAVIHWSIERVRTEAGMRGLGLTAFLVDVVAVFAFTWLYSYDPAGNRWVIIYILPLEGALRFQLRGALVTVGLTLANELGREAFLAHRFPHSGFYGLAYEQKYTFLFSEVAFRVGILAIIALVAGVMARSLAREARRASQTAQRFEELAKREMASRRELAAFNTAVLTGVAAEDLDASMQLMASAIAPDLAFETLTIFLREGDDLVVKGIYGMEIDGGRVRIGDGVTGTVALSGRPIVVSDVRRFPGYVCADPTMRSEMAVPMRMGDELIGVVDVESVEPDRFTVQDLGLLTRVADQIGLVAHSNRLLSQQRQTMLRLQELDQMKSDFVAITSHELRTPITAIRGFVKTLMRNRDRLTREQLASFLGTIDRQSARLARLVEDLLFVSRIEAGTVRFAREPVDLARFLHESVEALGPEGRSRVDVRVAADAGVVVIDPQRLDQILRNLVENALKFSPPDAVVTVAAELRAGTVTVEVADRGVGISPEDLPMIFDRFHQVGHVMTRENEGAGLGLYITKRLVEAMDGTIEVASTLGEGTTFTVRVPIPIGGDGAATAARAGGARDGNGRRDSPSPEREPETQRAP
jgi:signal transduction histidine kinase